MVSFVLTSGLATILRCYPLARERPVLPWSCTVNMLIVLLTISTGRVITSSSSSDPSYDILTPYPRGRHGSTRVTRDVSECQHFVWENRTYEEFLTPTQWASDSVKYQVLRFADVVHKTPLRRRYAIGTIALVEDPFHSFSILEPREKDGCKKKYFNAQRSTVQETAKQRRNGCRLAANAGYFNIHNGECLGNIVSSGRVVKSANGIANANFGVREDGSIVVGYISEADLQNRTNPFRQLVSGVVWLVRNGTNYVNESLKIECSDSEDTGSMKTFVEVLSARSAIGHDSVGKLILAHVEGQTHVRGVNLYEFADLLIRKGVVNAINLDGGGSSTFVEDGLLMNYPSDHCHYDSKYRCPREVSTIVCIHDPECLEPNCSDHGSCDKGVCSCNEPWLGEICNELNCSLTNCSSNGQCVNGSCECVPGWTGDFCEEACSSNHYGVNCAQTCFCYGKSHCDPVSGECICPAGLTGPGCWRECGRGLYGPNCRFKCDYPDCSDHGYCSSVTGECLCEEGWTGTSCNDTVVGSTAVPAFVQSSSVASELLSTPTNGLANHTVADLSVATEDTSNHKLTSAAISSPGSRPTTTTATTSTTTTTSTAAASSLLPAISQLSIQQQLCDNSVSTLSVSESPTPITNDQSSSSMISYESMVTIVIFTSLLTIIAHIVLCVFCRSGLGVVSTRADMRRELMERRQWEHLMQQIGTNWSSADSLSD